MLTQWPAITAVLVAFTGRRMTSGVSLKKDSLTHPCSLLYSVSITPMTAPSKNKSVIPKTCHARAPVAGVRSNGHLVIQPLLKLKINQMNIIQNMRQP